MSLVELERVSKVYRMGDVEVHALREVSFKTEERDFVAESLVSTGLVSAKMYLAPSQPLTEAHTATGGSFHSDGRVVVMQLRGASASKDATVKIKVQPIKKFLRPKYPESQPLAGRIMALATR